MLMKHTLSGEERDRLNQKVTAAEKLTGAQIVLAIIERSDSYAELPWKAFALGTSGAGLLVLLMNMMWPLPDPVMAALLAIVIMLAAGAGFALLCVFVPEFAKLFLHTHRAEVETMQYARSLFLSHELFGTPERRAVLLLVSLFERRIVVLPDAGLNLKINQDATEKIIAHMRTFLNSGQTARALEEGLKKLEELILSGGSTRELPNVIEERGA
jgi:putative membrane protein